MQMNSQMSFIAESFLCWKSVASTLMNKRLYNFKLCVHIAISFILHLNLSIWFNLCQETIRLAQRRTSGLRLAEGTACGKCLTVTARVKLFAAFLEPRSFSPTDNLKSGAQRQGQNSRAENVACIHIKCTLAACSFFIFMSHCICPLAHFQKCFAAKLFPSFRPLSQKLQ